jgi:hypothetical protein
LCVAVGAGVISASPIAALICVYMRRVPMMQR